MKNEKIFSDVSVSVARMFYKLINAEHLVNGANSSRLVQDVMGIPVTSLRPNLRQAIETEYGVIPLGVQTVGEFVQMRC